MVEEPALKLEHAAMRLLARPIPPTVELTSVIERVDFNELARQLARQRLLPLFGSRLLGIADSDQHVPAEFRRAVEKAIEVTRSEADSLEAETWILSCELERLGIRAVPLKGPFLAKRLYGDSGLRASSDVDLLVAAERLDDAVRALINAGCRPVRPITSVRPAAHHILVGFGSRLIEVHWRISLSAGPFSRQVVQRSTLRGGVRAPSPADELLILLIVYARDGLLGLRAPADVAACAHRYQDQLDPSEIAASLVAHPRIAGPVAAATAALEKALGIELNVVPRDGDRLSRRLAVALADPEASRSGLNSEAATALIVGVLGAPVRDFLRYVLFKRQPGRGPRRWLDQARFPVGLVRGMLIVVADVLRRRLRGA